MRPLIVANGTKCYSVLYCNSPSLYIRLTYRSSVISVKLLSLPGDSKKWGIDLFVAFGVRSAISPFLGGDNSLSVPCRQLPLPPLYLGSLSDLREGDNPLSVLLEGGRQPPLLCLPESRDMGEKRPPEKLLVDGFSTPLPLFCLICTIISNETCILD